MYLANWHQGGRCLYDMPSLLVAGLLRTPMSGHLLKVTLGTVWLADECIVIFYTMSVDLCVKLEQHREVFDFRLRCCVAA